MDGAAGSERRGTAKDEDAMWVWIDDLATIPLGLYKSLRAHGDRARRRQSHMAVGHAAISKASVS